MPSAPPSAHRPLSMISPNGLAVWGNSAGSGLGSGVGAATGGGGATVAVSVSVVAATSAVAGAGAVTSWERSASSPVGVYEATGAEFISAISGAVGAWIGSVTSVAVSSLLL